MEDSPLEAFDGVPEGAGPKAAATATEPPPAADELLPPAAAPRATIKMDPENEGRDAGGFELQLFHKDERG